MNKFYIRTLGCRLNQAESQELARKLLMAGWRELESPDKADLLVLNTCVVTQKAEKETRQAIRRLRRENPKAKLVVAGCWVDAVRKFGGEVPKGIDEMVGNQEKWGLLAKTLKLKTKNSNLRLKTRRRLIKIQTGCSNNCAFCLPYLVRGEPSSVPVEKIIRQIREAIKNGALEIVLTGQNITQYNDRGLGWVDLLEKVLRGTDIGLLRLGSVSPVFDPQKFVDVYQKWGRGRLARHLHLSLQSGSDRVLKLMGRNYTTKQFAGVVNILRRGVPGINITTDIIVGFPGETEKDFQKTLDFAQEAKFGKIHIFRYSTRLGTRAAQMSDQIAEKTKKMRAQQLAKLEKKLRHQFWQSQIGKKATAIVWQNGRGLSDNYIPVASLASRSSNPKQLRGLRAIRFIEIADNLVYFSCLEDT